MLLRSSGKSTLQTAASGTLTLLLRRIEIDHFLLPAFRAEDGFTRGGARDGLAVAHDQQARGSGEANVQAVAQQRDPTKGSGRRGGPSQPCRGAEKGEGLRLVRSIGL